MIHTASFKTIMYRSNRWFTIPPSGQGGDFTLGLCPSQGISPEMSWPRAGTSLQQNAHPREYHRFYREKKWSPHRVPRWGWSTIDLNDTVRYDEVLGVIASQNDHNLDKWRRKIILVVFGPWSPVPRLWCPQGGDITHIIWNRAYLWTHFYGERVELRRRGFQHLREEELKSYCLFRQKRAKKCLFKPENAFKVGQWYYCYLTRKSPMCENCNDSSTVPKGQLVAKMQHLGRKKHKRSENGQPWRHWAPTHPHTPYCSSLP